MKTGMCRALLTSYVAWCMVYGVLTPRVQCEIGCGLSDENSPWPF